VNHTFGDRVRTPDGFRWAPAYVKGIFWTLLDMPVIVQKIMNKKKLLPADVKNLVYTVNSTAAVLSIMMIMSALWEDEEDAPLWMQTGLTRYYSDLMSFMTLDPFLSVTANPIVFVSYYRRLFDTMIRATTYGMEGDNEKMVDKVKTIIHLINQFPEDDTD